MLRLLLLLLMSLLIRMLQIQGKLFFPAQLETKLARALVNTCTSVLAPKTFPFRAILILSLSAQAPQVHQQELTWKPHTEAHFLLYYCVIASTIRNRLP